MKKVLPIFLFLLGALVLVGAYFFVIKGKKEVGEVGDEEITLVEVPLEKRPITSLMPSDDGHWLKLSIEKILIDAYSLEYLLVYEFPDPETGKIKTNGVPGALELKNQSTIVRDLLMGSESSGNYRYDEGVEKGILTLRFRDNKGKLIAKFSTDFRLQNDGATDVLNSVDNELSYKLDKKFKRQSAFYVTMETLGVPGELDRDVISGPYGIFSIVGGAVPGTLEMGSGSVYTWDGGNWNKLESSESSDIGIFIATHQ